MISALPVYEDVVRVSNELAYPGADLEELTLLLGSEAVLKGFGSQGEDVFRDTLSIFKVVGTRKSNGYIARLADEEMIGLHHLSHDFARAPSSLARAVKYIDDKEVDLEGIPALASMLRVAVGSDAYEKGFAPWSLYYFLIALKKIQVVGQDEFFSALSMAKEFFPSKYFSDAYSQGYLWFVESILTFSEIGLEKSRSIISEIKDKTAKFYFFSLYSHNPRSFSEFVKLKSEASSSDIVFSFYGENICSDDVFRRIKVLLENEFSEKEYLDLSPSEFVSFLLEALTYSYRNDFSFELSRYLKVKYFCPLSKCRVYRRLSTIGPEIEVQKGLMSYDVDAAHMVAFLLLIQSSGDALIEFPLGPACYYGTLSEIVHLMRYIKISNEYLIPESQIIPLDVSISAPCNLVHMDDFKRKATALRVVNDILYTADSRLLTAFKAEPQDQSGIRYKLGLAKGDRKGGFDLIENRSGNLITNQVVEGVSEPLKAHERSFRFYQLMYSALVFSYVDVSSRSTFEHEIGGIGEDFLNEVVGLFDRYAIGHLLSIDTNQGNAFAFISKARRMHDGFVVDLRDLVDSCLDSIDNVICAVAIDDRMSELKDNNLEVDSLIAAEINAQGSLDKTYGDFLALAFDR